MTSVERVEEDAWPRVRDIRLAALRSDPGSFLASLEREEGFAERHWRMRLRGSAWFLATDATTDVVRDVGLVSVMQEPGAPPEDRHVVALWVHPDARGAGHGRRLLAAAEGWAARDGAATLSLWVVEGNEPAESLYRSTGWEPTGTSMTSPRDGRVEHRWTRIVGA